MTNENQVVLVTHLLKNNPAMYMSDPEGLARLIVAKIQENIQESATQNCNLSWRVTGKDKKG